MCADPKKYALKTQLWLFEHRFRTYQKALAYLDDRACRSFCARIVNVVTHACASIHSLAATAQTTASSPACIIDRSVWSDWVFAQQVVVVFFFRLRVWLASFKAVRTTLFRRLLMASSRRASLRSIGTCARIWRDVCRCATACSISTSSRASVYIAFSTFANEYVRVHCDTIVFSWTLLIVL